jgi:sodium transport system permease protein
MQSPLKSKYPSRKSVILVFAFTVVLCVFIGYLMTSLLGITVPGKWQIMIVSLLLPLPAYFYLRFYHYDIHSIFRLNLVSRRIAMLSVVLGLASFLLAYEIDRLLEMALPFTKELKDGLFAAVTASKWHEWPVILLAAVALPAVFEEMVFRGFVQSTFEQHHQALTAITITAAIFAVTHGLIQIFILGLFFGWMAWRSESIIPGAIAHAINNLFVVLLVNSSARPSWLFWQSQNAVPGEEHVHPILLLAAGGVIYFGGRLFDRFCEEEIEISTFFNTPA